MPRTARGAVTLAEEGPRSTRQRSGAAVLVVLVVGVVATASWLGAQHLLQVVAREQCRVAVGTEVHEWAPDQASNAAAITAISIKRGLPPRAASIAIATAMQESKVRNVQFGDRDSLGLFQQRPSQGWGTAEQILDPEYSTNRFYDELLEVEGFADMEIADAAQAVQRSAAGGAYAQHEAKARATASALSGESHAAVGCALREPEEPGNAEGVVALVDKDLGLRSAADGSTVTVQTDSEDLAWAVASWAVARATDTGATEVVIGDRRWTRAMTKQALAWEQVDSTVGATTVTIGL
jgi:hypothetical protein